MDEKGKANNLTIMTFSEFGRRVNENGSQGTDHGTAEPMFVIRRSGQRRPLWNISKSDGLG